MKEQAIKWCQDNGMTVTWEIPTPFKAFTLLATTAKGTNIMIEYDDYAFMWADTSSPTNPEQPLNIHEPWQTQSIL